MEIFLKLLVEIAGLISKSHTKIKDSTYAHECPQDSACDNTVGSYDCICNVGYQSTTGSGKDIVCENIDECVAGVEVAGGFGILGGRKRRATEDACPDNANCTDTVGSFTCACVVGYE